MNGEVALGSFILGILLGVAVAVVARSMVLTRRFPLEGQLERVLKEVDDLARVLDRLSEEMKAVKHPEVARLNGLRYAVERLKEDLLEIALPEILGRR